MYDKYSQANQFSLSSSKLPKHKGILFTGATAGTASSTQEAMIENALKMKFHLMKTT